MNDKIAKNRESECLINIESFNGSFDLLVLLIKEKKMDIMNLNLIEITKQYVDFVNKNINLIKIDDLTEYLLLASYLLELKSKKALPTISTNKLEQQDIEKERFINRLVVYKQYKNIASILNENYENRQKMYDKESNDFYEYLNNNFDEDDSYLPKHVNINKILKAMQKICLRLEQLKNPKQEVTKIEVNEISIDIVENEIKQFLRNYEEFAKITLDEYIYSIPDEKFSRQYFVVAFVAILVLVRNGYILIEQDETDSQIFIIKNKESEILNYEDK